MTKFIPLVDVNTKHVLQWTSVDEHGNETIVETTSAQWKQVSDWSQEELHSLFAGSTTVEQPEELVEELEHEKKVF
jgi:hypothetical protein